MNSKQKAKRKERKEKARLKKMQTRMPIPSVPDLPDFENPLLPRYVIIRFDASGAPSIDAKGLDPWALYSLLTASAEAVWESLPSPFVEEP